MKRHRVTDVILAAIEVDEENVPDAKEVEEKEV
jgi:hypothetical protein